MMINLRNRRLLAVLVSGALVAAACGGGDDDADTADTDTGTDTEATSQPTDAASGEATDDATDAADESSAAENDDDAESSEAGSASGDDDTDAAVEDADQITSEGEGGSEDPADLEPVAGGEVTWGLTNDGTGFDTTAAIAPGTSRLLGALSDALAGVTADNEWHPNLAESLTPNDDFTAWTIGLREGIVFHDGEPVDADAVVANMEAFRSSPSVGYSFGVVDTITAVDELTVEVTMTEPWATFPFTLSGQPGVMVSPSTIGTNETFVGTGPFMLESWTPGDGARVVRNPNYWRADEGLPYLDAINFKYLVEQPVKRQAFEAGDIQGYISPSDEDILDFLDDDAIDVWISTGAANEYLFLLNTTTPPFDDVRVRRALAHATDRQFIIDNFRAGLTTPASGPLNPASKWFTETDYPDYDPDAAQALVDEYEAEVGPIEFEVSAEPNPSVIEVIETAISFWGDVGIDATIKEIGQGQSAGTAIQDDFQAFSWYQFGTPDPDGNYIFFHSNGGALNWTNLVNEQIDTGLAMGRQNADEATRKEGYAMFQQALADEVPIIWIDHLNGVEAAVSIPEIHGIGVPGEFVDGTPSIPMTSGSFFPWTGVWMEQ